MSETQTAETPSQTEEIGSFMSSASDALTDDMVSRLAGTFGEALDMLDRINRSRLERALPAIRRRVENGDLERIAHLARRLGGAEEALTDEMIARLADVATDALSLLEQLTRNNALGQILSFLLRPEVQNVLVSWGEALLAASNEYQKVAAAERRNQRRLALARRSEQPAGNAILRPIRQAAAGAALLRCAAAGRLAYRHGMPGPLRSHSRVAALSLHRLRRSGAQ